MERWVGWGGTTSAKGGYGGQIRGGWQAWSGDMTRVIGQSRTT